MKTRDPISMSGLDFSTTSTNWNASSASLQNNCNSKRPHPYDIEIQSYNSKMVGDIDPHSPYYSPLEAQKQMGTILQAWRSAEKYTENYQVGCRKSKSDCFFMLIIA
jgi:hypothetical protein